jgi:hypothetical protein
MVISVAHLGDEKFSKQNWVFFPTFSFSLHAYRHNSDLMDNLLLVPYSPEKKKVALYFTQ